MVKKETILVTGASSGIGRELARVGAADGRDLILVARREDELTALAKELAEAYGVGVSVIPMDLAQPDAAARLVTAVAERGLQVDLLINNAGFGLHGPFTASDPAEQLAMIQLNVTTLTGLTQRLLEGMVARGYGRILNVASTAAFAPGPYMAVYHATKAYVLAFSDALWYELRGTGVTVTALCPGPVLSGFQARSNMGLTLGHRLMLTDAAHVAKAGYRAMRRGRMLVVPGLLNRLLVLGTRLSPRWGIAAAVGHFSRARGEA